MLLLVFKGTLVGTEAMQLHMFSQSVKSLIKHNKYTIKTADRGQCPTIMYELSQCFLVIQCLHLLERKCFMCSRELWYKDR